MSSSQYKLSQQIITDATPIRSISYNATSSTLYSGSESGVVSKVHLPTNTVSILNDESSIQNDDASSSTTTDPKTIVSELIHDHHITAMICNDQYYVTGCKDTHVRIFDMKTNQRLFLCKGHEKPVTSLSFLHFATGQVFAVSGSWDGTAKVWNLKTGVCCATLDGHENTVSVQGLPPPPSLSTSSSTSCVARLATGSAGVATGNSISDYKIRVYDIASPTVEIITSLSATLQSTISNDHQGPIRSLSFDQKLQLLLSCSNDGSVKLRETQTGSCVQTLNIPLDYVNDELGINFQHQQPPMLLDVASNNNDAIVACGEDGNLIVWSIEKDDGGGESSTPSEPSIETQIIPHPNCIWKVLTLPNNDIVTACNDGMIRIFTKDADRIASDDVMETFREDAIKSNQKKSSGPSNDEIAKLPKWENNFNLSGKSEGAVQVFNKNGKAIAAQWSQASKTWIEVGEVTGQVGGESDNAGTINGTKYDFVFPIEVDVPNGGVQKLQIGYNNGENPFVTAQAFIDEYMLDQGYLAQIADYIRTRVGQDGYVPTIGTEESRNGTPAPMDYTATPSPSYQHLPMKGYKSFETGTEMKTLMKVSKKIAEFNTALNSNLSQDELTNVLGNLLETISATSRYHATTVSDAELQILLKMMKQWSLVHVFPAMDLARLIVLHPDASSMSRSNYWNEVIGTAIDRCNALLQQVNTIEGPAKVAIPMLSMRLFANSFRGGSGSRVAIESHLAR